MLCVRTPSLNLNALKVKCQAKNPLKPKRQHFLVDTKDSTALIISIEYPNQPIKMVLTQNFQNLPEYTESQVRECAGDRCIVIIYELVYDLTDFLDEHPGGMESLLEMSGMDATNVFEDVGHSQLARTVMLRYAIGRLAANEKRIPEYLINATLSAISSFIRN